jgi:TonB family protein
VSVTILFIVLLLGAAHYFFENDQQIQQASASPSPASVVPQVSGAAPTPASAPTKEERPQPTVAPLRSPAAPSFPNESATAPRITADGTDKIYSGNDVSSLARILSKPQPSYTEEARQNQVTGTVVLRAVFTSEGEVTNITARSGLPNGLTERAIQAARQIKFVPATKDGRPVSMYIQLEYNFNLY